MTWDIYHNLPLPPTTPHLGQLKQTPRPTYATSNAFRMLGTDTVTYLCHQHCTQDTATPPQEWTWQSLLCSACGRQQGSRHSTTSCPPGHTAHTDLCCRHPQTTQVLQLVLLLRCHHCLPAKHNCPETWCIYSASKRVHSIKHPSYTSKLSFAFAWPR